MNVAMRSPDKLLDLDGARSLEELARIGPCELPELHHGLAMLGKPGDVPTAIRLAKARARTSNVQQAVYRVRTNQA